MFSAKTKSFNNTLKSTAITVRRHRFVSKEMYQQKPTAEEHVSRHSKRWQRDELRCFNRCELCASSTVAEALSDVFYRLCGLCPFDPNAVVMLKLCCAQGWVDTPSLKGCCKGRRCFRAGTPLKAMRYAHAVSSGKHHVSARKRLRARA